MKKEALKQWRVEVVEHKTDAVVHTIPCSNERNAGRVDGGVQINLDHERFFTRIVGPK